MRLLRFDEALVALDGLEARRPAAAPGVWTPAQAVAHCAQSVECSLRGYPRLRSPLFRTTIGKLVKWRFLSAGAMAHDTQAPIAGAPPIDDLPLAEAARRLREAIAAFRAADAGSLQPHLAYGPCTKDEYEALHCMHLADHMAGL